MTKIMMLAVWLGLAAAAQAADSKSGNPYATNPYLKNAPITNPMMVMPKGTGDLKNMVPWQMSQMPTPEQKQQFMKAMMPYLDKMGLNIRDVLNYMTVKYEAKADLSFDDVVESMKLRANQLNLKQVGHSPMIKDIQAVLGDTTTPRMEVFHFCDITTAREVMKTVPEAIVFLPCRIAVMEDNNKRIWVLTLDWDMSWLDTINGSMGITPELAKMAIDMRDRIDNVMHAAANGDL